MSDSYFDGKVVWITGASSGIGEALALGLAAQGAQLVLSARNLDALQVVEKKCDAAADRNHLVLPFDVTEEASLPQIVEQAQSLAGRIDMLINNAGISQRSSCLETEMSTYRTLFDVDVFAPIALTKAVLPGMVQQGSGHIVVMASVAGKIGVPFRTGYSAAKHSVMGFFDSLRAEVTHQNISVSTITPGYIRTNISENALCGDGQRFGRVDSNIAGGMSPEECADIIINNLAKGKTEIAVGKGLEMHALWMKRLFPKWLEKQLADRYRKRS